MSTSEGDIYLIEAVQRGDADAWRQVIDRYQGRLVSFARRMLAQPSEAEDLVQETFLGLLRSLPTYDRARSLETYLFAILRNKLSDHFRKQRGGQRQSLDQLDMDDAPQAWVVRDTPSRQAEAQEALDSQTLKLAQCLRHWVEQCQAQARFQELIAIEMLVVLGLRNKEVAADLDLTETAVAGIKFRVLERWRQLATDGGTACDWQDADIAENTSVAQLWRDEGVSCLKRSTLGRYLLDALTEDWQEYADFHLSAAACPRCQANLEDLREEDRAGDAARAQLRERCFASSVGFLSRRPE